MRGAAVGAGRDSRGADMRRIGGRKDGADKAYDEHIAVGAALGLLFGVMLNGCGLWEDHALGIAIGPLWGMAIAAMDGRGRPKEKK